jgi:O-antigen/teichoic acid export membrane protein
VTRPAERSGLAAETEELGFWRTRRWWILAGQASAGVYVAAAMSFVATLAAARALGPSGFGALELAVVAVGAVAVLLDFSLEEAVIFHGTRALAAGDPAGLRDLVRRSLAVDVAIGVGVLALVAVAAPWFGDAVSRGELPAALVRLAALEAFAGTVNGTTGALLVVGGRPHLRAWASAFANAARVAGVLVAAALDAGPIGILAGLVAGSALGSAAQATWAWRTGRRLWAARPAPGVGAGVRVATRQVLWFGINSSATTTLVAVRMALVSVLLGRTLGPTAVGVLAVAMFPIAVVEVASSPLRLVMIPEQATLAARGRPDVVWDGLLAYAKASLLVGIPGAAIGWVALPGLLPFLYGSGFDAAVGPARILLVAALASLVVAWAKALPAALGRPAIRTAMVVAEIAATAVLVVALHERGVRGVAAALSIAAVLVAAAWWLVARRMLRAPAGSREAR